MKNGDADQRQREQDEVDRNAEDIDRRAAVVCATARRRSQQRKPATTRGHGIQLAGFAALAQAPAIELNGQLRSTMCRKTNRLKGPLPAGFQSDIAACAARGARPGKVSSIAFW